MTSIFKPAMRYLRMAGICIAACVIVATASSVLAQEMQYAIIRLDTIEEVSGGSAINNTTEVAGVAIVKQFAEPLLWKRGHLITLGNGGGYDADAEDISDLGVSVGFYELADWHDVPFVWTRKSNGMIPLPLLNGFDEGRANAVNNAGVIVGINRQYGVGESRAVQWIDGVISELPNFGMWGGEAKDINEAGWIVGWLIDENNYWQPVLWQDGSITELGAFDEYVPHGEATGVNDVGQVTGWSNDRSDPHAFLWQDGEMVDIHNPYLGWVTSLAWAINDNSEVVGALAQYGTFSAFLWQPGSEMIELSTCLPPQSNWTKLDDARDINDFGQIVGYGRRSDASNWGHGYLMTPVYPTFTLDQPLPGIAGEVNTITARNLTPGTKVYFAYSTTGGGAIIPACDIIQAALQIEDPLTAGIAVANENGVARLTGKVPSKWAGQEVLMQAVIVGDCEISNLIVQKFN